MSLPVVTGLGVVSGLGQGRTEFVEGWSAGAAGTQIGRMRLRDHFPEHRTMLRRMDRLSKMICLAAGLACSDRSGLGSPEGVALGVGTDLGTLEETWAFLNRLRTKGPALANPLDFPNLVPNAGAGYAGILLGLTGPSFTFCQHETCGDEALAWACEGIRSGWFDAALAGGADEQGAIREKARQAAGCFGAPLASGESSAMLVLESQARAAARGVEPLAAYVGTWAGCAPPSRSPLIFERNAEPLQALADRALEEAGLTPGDLGFMVCSSPGLLNYDAPQTDHHQRLGVHPADGALRAALATCLLADSSLPVNAGGETARGSVGLLASAARGGSLRVTLLRRIEK